jgi:hypothetical protein
MAMGFVDTNTALGAKMKREVETVAIQISRILIDVPSEIAANSLITVLGALIVQGARDPFNMVEQCVECLRDGVDENA